MPKGTKVAKVESRLKKEYGTNTGAIQITMMSMAMEEEQPGEGPDTPAKEKSEHKTLLGSY
jgi:hypothetical protein